MHGKHGIVAAVRIDAFTGRDCDLDDLVEAVQAMPAMPGVPRVASAPGFQLDTGPRLSARDLMTRPIHEGAVDDATRFEAMSSVIGHWLRQARIGTTTLKGAWHAVRDYNLAMIRPPCSRA